MATMTRKECLQALRCQETATPMEIVAAYKRLRKRFHPDTKDTGDHAKFIHVTEAFKVLAENFNMETLAELKKDKEFEELDTPSLSLKKEKSVEEQLKQKLNELGGVDELYTEIVSALIDKMEFHTKIADCHLILLPKLGSTTSVDLKGTKLRLMIVTERNPKVSAHSAYMRFSQDGRRMLPDTDLILSDEMFDRFLHFLAYQDFSIRYQDSTEGPDPQILSNHSILGMLAQINPKFSVYDVCATINILGKREFIKISESREMVEKYIREIVKKGSHTFVPIPELIRREKGAATDTYVKVKWDNEEYCLLRDGLLYISKSKYLREREFEVIKDQNILAYFVECYEECRDSYEDSKNEELIKKLQEKNAKMREELGKRQDLKDILGKIKQGLLE